ncbi:MAG: GntR family transcriptional regulator [Lachnospiraceae bacterium]|nr:GntR family transcriptional regulator [Lachnospiraceae bacterium]
MAWDFESDRPIYTQLLEKIQLMIISGKFKPGDRLPSVRDLSSEAAVNPNTMQRALQELERQGLVYSQRTSGRMVTQDTELIKSVKEKVAINHVKSFLETMNELGFEQQEIQGIITLLSDMGDE